MLALAPDAVILAVGASSFTPRSPGVDGPNVRDAWKVLAGEQEVSGRVAIIGGGVVGCETAEHLGSQGYKVSIVEMQGQMAIGLSTTVLPTMLENYRKFGVDQYTGHKVLEIASSQLICTDKDGRVVRIPCDIVVIASGARPVAFER